MAVSDSLGPIRPIYQISLPSIATPAHCFWVYSYWILNVWMSLLKAWIIGISYTLYGKRHPAFYFRIFMHIDARVETLSQTLCFIISYPRITDHARLLDQKLSILQHKLECFWNSWKLSLLSENKKMYADWWSNVDRI